MGPVLLKTLVQLTLLPHRVCKKSGSKGNATLQFTQLSFTESNEFNDKVFVQKIQTSNLRRKRPRCYQTTNKAQVTDRIFKWTLIPVSVIFKIYWIG